MCFLKDLGSRNHTRLSKGTEADQGIELQPNVMFQVTNEDFITFGGM